MVNLKEKGKMPKCANWMNFEAIRETIEKRWENHEPEDSPKYNLTDLNLTRNCIVCDFGGSGTGSALIDEMARLLESRTIALQEMVEKLSGGPLKRACFKDIKEVKNGPYKKVD